ncbi:ABC transporter permease [Cupriavidus necator]|nr:ABC transporter permease [Cupriavidus necator]QQX83632.1 ABC transporter permease [Cupriavidus necator]
MSELHFPKQTGVAGLSLAWMLAKRDLRNRYANSYAGVAWNIGVPLLYSLINVIVFSILMHGRIGGDYGTLPFALFYFVPFSLWTVFAEVMNRSPGILREYSYLINKIAFPAWVLPLIPLASAFLSQIIIFAIVGVLLYIHGIVPAASCWLFVAVWLIATTITIGCAYIVSAISVYIPDLGQIVPVIVNILFWLTPILYPASLVENSRMAWVKPVLMDANPFYHLVESARISLFGTASFPAAHFVIPAVFALVVLAIGALTFRKLQPGFADVI